MMNLLMWVVLMTSQLLPGNGIKPAQEDIQQRVSGYLDQAIPGVFFSESKDTKGGQIIRLFAVGTAPIRASLGSLDGLEMARERAQESAREELVRFLASKVKVRITARDEVVITKEGGEDGQKETGKKVETRSREVEETAAALIRGLRVAGARQNGDEKRYVVVYRWEASAADAAVRVADRMTMPPKVVKPVTEKRIVVKE